jgi:hypothetical protein
MGRVVVVVFVAASGSLGAARRDDEVGRKLLGGGSCVTGRSGRHGISYPSNVRYLTYDILFRCTLRTQKWQMQELWLRGTRG